jgi:DNA-directed RNA polymerase subunit M/transcription elongation factor TFIIS
VQHPVPFKADEESEVMKEEIKHEQEKLTQLKRKHKEVCILMCGKCKLHTMMMHLENCISCGARNTYFEADQTISAEQTETIKRELMQILGFVEFKA